MKFLISQSASNLTTLVRDIGYRPLGYTPAGELNCVRPLGADYPRFHLYIREEGSGFIFSLHLDQKKPSYGRETAHSGEYDGETVKSEAQRIQYTTQQGGGMSSRF